MSRTLTALRPLQCSSFAASFRAPYHKCSCRISKASFFSLSDLTKLGSASSDEGSNGRHDGLQNFHETKDFKYSAEELYNIVADVDSYDLFLPNCLQSRVLGPATPAYPINIPKSRRSEFSPTSTPGRREGKAVRAELTVGFKAFRESYTSRVEMVSPRYVNATADTASNPLFKHLYTEWSFHPISAQYSGSTVPLSLFGQTASSSTSRPSPSAPPSSSTTRPTQSLTRLDFHLEYAFRNPIYGLVASQAFDVMARKMMNAFEERAIQLYGRR